MQKMNPLNYKLLRKKLNARQLDFETTEELDSLIEFVGQERALKAMAFGIGIKSQGYNLYALGPAGVGKRSLIRILLREQARNQAVPSDWCYVHNFEIPEKPIALELPPGYGVILQQDMKSLIEELSTSILAVFEGDEYREGLLEINNEFNAKRAKILKKNTTDIKNERVLHLYKERHTKEKALQLRFTSAVVDPLIHKIKTKFTEFPQVAAYLSAVQKDIIVHINDLVKSEESTYILFFSFENPLLIKYEVNLLVDNGKRKSAPVISVHNPSYSNLICRIEHTSQMGALVTNFTLIRPGALHKANGGYILIEISKIKKEPQAWEALKRALYSRKIKIEPLEHLSETFRSVSLQPMTIPLDIKVILLGDQAHFYELSRVDPDFIELFKVLVEFDEQIDRNRTNIEIYARMIGTIVKKEKFLPFHRSAIAAIIDHSSRLAADAEKLSTHLRSINDLIIEANYWANLWHKTVVDDTDIKKAVEAQIYRRDQARENYYDDIKRHFIMIQTSGTAVGQVNCLSVVNAGKFSFGHPTRLTAVVRMGKGKIIDIQREIAMGGPMLTKGGLIISSFLAGRYNPGQIFSLSASLAFEQIYGTIDGDSASVAELCVLISALAQVPIKQSLAITGSTNQHGEVQAIGGVNEKIEGFFDICHSRGLTGKQGVLIPAVNVKNLMLRDDIVKAAKDKKFFIYPINTIDEAISLLTGLPSGEPGKNKSYPKNTLNYLVEKKLEEFSNNYLLSKRK
jgi:lon-related putative ATP-dependent protease